MKLDNWHGNLSIKITLYKNNLEQQQNPVYVTYLGITQGLEIHRHTITWNNLCYEMHDTTHRIKKWKLNQKWLKTFI